MPNQKKIYAIVIVSLGLMALIWFRLVVITAPMIEIQSSVKSVVPMFQYMFFAAIISVVLLSLGIIILLFQRTKALNLRYRWLFETAQEGIFLVDFNTGIILDVNKFLIDLLGYSKTDFLKKHLWEVGVFKDIAASRNNFLELQTKKYIRYENLPLETKGGKKIFVEFISNVYRVENKEIIQCNIRDITDRKIAEQKLLNQTRNLENANRASQNVLEDLSAEKSKVEIARVKEEALLENIGDGVVATDKDGKIMLMNHAAEQMLGWESEQAIGKSLAEVWNIFDEKGKRMPETERPVVVALRGVITTANTTAGPAYFYTRKDGTKFPVAINVTPVVSEHKIIGAINVFRDISKEKDIDKAKTEFVSLASHQLRTPLTTISWYTEMILKGDVGKVIPGQKKYLEEIYRGNQRMIELVNTLLNVSRLELGTFKVESKPTDVIALARSVLDEQKPKIKKKKLIIIQKLDKDIPAFSTDPKLLRMVFQNLLANSVEYTPPGGKIEVSVSLYNPKTMFIKVSDTGYGIPEDQQDKIFVKFFRADNVREKDSDGTGLGLYIVKSIIESSGGKIWFESEENKGTTFYVKLPFDGMGKKDGTKALGK